MDHSDTKMAARAHARFQRVLSKDGEDERVSDILASGSAFASGKIESIMARAKRELVPFTRAGAQSDLVVPTQPDETTCEQFGYRLAQKGKSRIDRRVVMAYQNDHQMADEMRTIRTSLVLQWLGDTEIIGRSLAVVSEQSGQGRSVLVANLGVAFAQAGFSTLIVDANLRKPSIHQMFGLNNQKGLSTALARRGSSTFKLHEVPGLAILPAGETPPNPTELLNPRRVDKLLRACAMKYQVVLVDTPAMRDGPDAELVASQTSGCMTLGVAGQSQVDALKARSEKLNRVGANMVGTVFVQK